MDIALNLAIADHHIRLPCQDRRDQSRNLTPWILIVSIGIDDDISAEAQRCINAGLIGGRQSFATGMAHHVVGAVRQGDGNGIIGAPVVDDQRFDARDARNVARNIGEDARDRLSLVEHGGSGQSVSYVLRMCHQLCSAILAEHGIIVKHSRLTER